MTLRTFFNSTAGQGFQNTKWPKCIALLCSVSRVASASFSFLIFNDVLVSSSYTSSEHFYLEEGETILAWGTKIFVALGEHGFSFFQVKLFTGSVSVLLTSTLLKI